MPEYINKQELVDYIRSTQRSLFNNRETIPDYLTRDTMLLNFAQMLDLVPKADVAPIKHGYWQGICIDYGVCSECVYISKNIYKYCPKCGAKMDGGADNGSKQ